MTTQPTSQPGADQPLVTHADLGVLQHLRIATGPDFEEEDDGRVSALLDRLIAAAEADKPALPEGWVQLTNCGGEGGQRVFWHAEGCLYLRHDRVGLAGYVENHRDRLAPLATAASLAPEGWHVDEDGDGRPTVWDAADQPLVGKVGSGHPSPIFDVLAALVTAANAERGESR